MTAYTKLIIQCDRPMCPERYEHFGDSEAAARLNAYDNAGFVQRDGRDYCKNHRKNHVIQPPVANQDTRCGHVTDAGQCLNHRYHTGDHQHPQEQP